MERSDDILREILFCLPPRSLFRFMCVSKRWNNLIMDPLFIKTYDSERRRRKGRILGFVQCNTKCLTLTAGISEPWVSRHNFLSVGEDGHGGNFPAELGYFISASNSRFLCGCIPTTYHVVNPITKRWVSLPSPPQRFTTRSVGLACDEDSNDYKVVVAGTYIDGFDNAIGLCDVMPLETYSSVTGKWTESVVSLPWEFLLRRLEPPLVTGGVFHWYTIDRDLIVYNSSSSLEEDEESRKCVNPQFVQVPFPTNSTIIWRTDNGETLWFGASNRLGMKIFRLPIGKYSHKRGIGSDEWTLVYTVETETFMYDLIEVIKKEEATDKRLVARYRETQLERQILYDHRDCFYMVGVLPWKPQCLLVRLRESIYLYDVKEDIMYIGVLHGCPSFTDFEWDWYPYFEPVSLLSYTFGLEQSKSRATNLNNVEKNLSINRTTNRNVEKQSLCRSRAINQNVEKQSLSRSRATNRNNVEKQSLSRSRATNQNVGMQRRLV